MSTKTLVTSRRYAAFDAVTDLREQAASLRLPIAISGIFCAFVLGSAVLLHLWRGVPFRALMQDPTAYLGVQAYVGIISTLGIILWMVATTACLLAAWVLSRAAESPETRRFLIASAAFSLLLGSDDMLQLHEDILPLVGIPQTAVLGGYVVLGLAYAYGFRKAIFAQKHLLFLIGIAFLAVSIAIDALTAHGDLQTFFEDGAKLIGIVFWAAFFVISAARAVDPKASHRPA